MQAPSLTTFLVENHDKFGTDYENFLTGTGGFPSLIKGHWKLVRSIKVDKQLYFADLAQKIVEEGSAIAKAVPEVEKLILRFNVEWMKTRNEKGVLKDHPVQEIWFNSKNIHYCWLSNFFQTLIYCDEPTPGVFMGVESAYKAYKAVIAGADQETILTISRTTDLAKAKKVKIDLPEEDTVNLMTTLIHNKFDQNPLLSERLKSTQPFELVEHTDNAFWGDGSSSNAMAKGEGQNVLGKILMKERQKLTELSSVIKH